MFFLWLTDALRPSSLHEVFLQGACQCIMRQVRIGECWVQWGQVQDCDLSLTGVGEAAPLEFRFYVVVCLTIPQCFCHGSRDTPWKAFTKAEGVWGILRVYTVLVWVILDRQLPGTRPKMMALSLCRLTLCWLLHIHKWGWCWVEIS